VFAYHSSQVKISRAKRQPHFFKSFPAGTSIRRFANGHVEFAAGRAPEAEIWFVGPFEQQYPLLLIETVEQRGNFIGQRHRNVQFGAFSDLVSDGKAQVNERA